MSKQHIRLCGTNRSTMLLRLCCRCGRCLRLTAQCLVTLQGVNEERLVRDILLNRSSSQKLSRPVDAENDTIDVQFSVVVHHVVKVVRIITTPCIEKKKLSYRRETARRSMSVEILSTAAYSYTQNHI